MMQSRSRTGSSGYSYQRRCCPSSAPDREGSLSARTTRGTDLLCCCCSCSTASSSSTSSTLSTTPGLLASLGVCVLVLGYTLLGAFAFMALEGGLKSEPNTILSTVTGTTKLGSTTSLGDEDKFTSSSSSWSKDAGAAIELRERTVERLWSITEDLNVLYKENWTRLAAREVLEFQESLTRGLRLPHSVYRALPPPLPPPATSWHRANHNAARRWTFGSSLLYSLTLITTIGYGSVAPHTVWGRLITIIYALAGIPLMLVYLSTVGDVLARSFRRLYGRLCRPRNCARKSSGLLAPGVGKSCPRYDNHVGMAGMKSNFYPSKESSCDDLDNRGTTAGSVILLDCGNESLQTASSSTALQELAAGTGNTDKKHYFHPSSCSTFPDAMQRIPVSLCLAIILLYICAGALMFNRLEGWTLLEGSYFCFTSLGTIGFGDLVPGGRNAPSPTLEELSLCACSLYILAGMGLIAMCFNLVQEEVVRAVRLFGRMCGMATAGGEGVSAGTGMVGGKTETEDGSNDSSRLSEEEAIAMSVVSAS